MANQSKFVPPELLHSVLEHLNIKEQFKLRRVSKDFKHVIEVQIWPVKKELNITAIGLNADHDIPTYDWEFMLSHMPKLKVVILIRSTQIFRCLSKHIICPLFAKYCQGINKFGRNRNYDYDYAMEYVKQLSKLGVYDTSIKIVIEDDHRDHWEMFDGISTESKFKLNIVHAAGIPSHFHDKISSITKDFKSNKPYLPNLREIGDATRLTTDETFRDFVSKYHSQITMIGCLNLKFVDKMFLFSNLTYLSIITYYITLELEEESKCTQILERYLKSDASCHLDSLSVQLKHDVNAIRLINLLSTLDRLRKWKQLEVLGCVTRLHYALDIFQFYGFPPSESLTLVTNLFDKIRSPRTIVLQFDHDIMMNKKQFDNWKQWIETYASKHRNMDFKVEMSSYHFRIPGRKQVTKNGGGNWTIVYAQNML